MHCFTCYKMRLDLRWCTPKFSQLPHMRTSISPDLWLVYIPLNMSTWSQFVFHMACLRQYDWKREKKSADNGTSWTLCRSVVPWRFTARFRPADRLCLLEMVPSCFPISLSTTRQCGREKSPTYIYHNVINVSSMWYILRFEHTHAHVLKLI